MPDGRAIARTALASFLVLFLEVVLIRWLPAYVRLLSYFSNVILLGAFLGIGLGCLLVDSKRRLFVWYPVLQIALVLTVYLLRLEVTVPTTGSIYFTSGTNQPVTPVESTIFLPVLFLGVVAIFMTLAQEMAREMARLPPLAGYTANLVGSIAGVVLFGVLSSWEIGAGVWFAVAAATAMIFVVAPAGATVRTSSAQVAIQSLLVVGAVTLVAVLGRGVIWSPYYKISVAAQGQETIISVNDIFHQSAGPVAEKEYFYQWPYMAFGDTFDNVLILGAGSGTDVAAALMHGARHVDAVEIDPAIIRLGRELHPDRPYDDPRVTVINDDARHFLRRTDQTYDLVVFALIDSLTLQSGFSGVRLESYMFTEESFRAVRARLRSDGLLVIYNYFREPWLVDRLANSAAEAFGAEPRVYVHEARSFLGVLMAGPRLARLSPDVRPPDRVLAFGQSRAPSPARIHVRDPAIEPAQDDWPFLYLRARGLPAHYAFLMVFILVVSSALVVLTRRGRPGRWSWEFFLLGAGFMLLETRAITGFALLWGATWVVASLAILSVLVMALAANLVVSRVRIRTPALVGAVLVGLVAVNFVLPVGSVTFDSLAAESAFFAVLGFSPIFCAGLLFGSAVQKSPSLPYDFGTNLLGAMVGGTLEYFSLVVGFRWLLVVVAACYVGAVIARRRTRGSGLAATPSPGLSRP